MNRDLPVPASPEDLAVAHCVVGYDRTTEKHAAEFEIPRFLDSLALKIAEVAESDPDGIFSYPLSGRQADIFGFLLGLPIEPERLEYFLEPTARRKIESDSPNAEAAATFSQLLAESESQDRGTRRITESELTLPTLRILEEARHRVIVTDLIGSLTKSFRPTGTDAEILAGRSGTYFLQQVRNIIFHKDSPGSFIRNGLAEYRDTEDDLRITPRGQTFLRSFRIR